MPANKRVVGSSFALLAGLVFVGWLTTQAVSNCATGACRFVPLVANPLVAPTAPPTATTDNVVVKSYASYNTSGQFTIYGEVANNNTTHTVYPFNMQAKLYDTSNQLLATALGNFLVQKLNPGQTSPFEIKYVGGVATRVARAELSFLYNISSARNYQSLTILSRDVSPGRPNVSGVLRNDHAQTMGQAMVSVTYYDAAGNVLAVAWAGSFELAPGAWKMYEVVSISTPLPTQAMSSKRRGISSHEHPSQLMN
jgi:hypothetical protein